MIRYRPPAPRKSPYVTPEGKRTLLSEQKALWLRRREVVAALSVAAAEGDRSENAEYIYRKKELREIDGRIRYLQKRLPDLNVIDKKPARSDQVFFGATVTLEDKNEALVCYRIVGPDEFDHAEHYISVDSPLARSLLKRELGDEIEVQVPNGRLAYCIVDIAY
ncbi:transcription elongation factor GreB [Draconibacterium sp.]|nr:transcription elongation factor GreB [Draconibacterium sp.]